MVTNIIFSWQYGCLGLISSFCTSMYRIFGPFLVHLHLYAIVVRTGCAVFAGKWYPWEDCFWFSPHAWMIEGQEANHLRIYVCGREPRPSCHQPCLSPFHDCLWPIQRSWRTVQHFTSRDIRRVPPSFCTPPSISISLQEQALYLKWSELLGVYFVNVFVKKLHLKAVMEFLLMTDYNSTVYIQVLFFTAKLVI